MHELAAAFDPTQRHIVYGERVPYGFNGTNGVIPRPSEAKSFCYKCTNCDNIETGEREITCWKCGIGDMVLQRVDFAEVQRRLMEEKPRDWS